MTEKRNPNTQWWEGPAGGLDVDEWVGASSTPKYYALFSGGKDSNVLAHYLQSKGQLKSCVFFDTGISATGVLDYIKTVPYPIEIYRTDKNYEDLVRKFGFGRPWSHTLYMSYLKGRPLRMFKRAHKGETVILASGVRKHESKRRFTTVKAIGKFEGLEIHAPIMDWTDQMVWDYVKEHNLKLSPAYETLHISGECLCGAYAPPDEKWALKTFDKQAWERIRALELEVGGVWGNSKLPNKMKEGQEPLFCQECRLV